MINPFYLEADKTGILNLYMVQLFNLFQNCGLFLKIFSELVNSEYESHLSITALHSDSVYHHMTSLVHKHHFACLFQMIPQTARHQRPIYDRMLPINLCEPNSLLKMSLLIGQLRTQIFQINFLPAVLD